MGWRRVEVEVVLLHILAVVSFISGQPEQAFFEDRVVFIPEGKRKAKQLMAVGDAGNSVFVPAVSARAGVIVRKKFPGVAVSAVVLANGAPGSLAKIWAPAFPVLFALAGFLQTNLFLSHRCSPIYSDRLQETGELLFDLDLPLFSIELQSMAERLLQPLRFFAGRLTIFELKFHPAGQRELK